MFYADFVTRFDQTKPQSLIGVFISQRKLNLAEHLNDFL